MVQVACPLPLIATLLQIGLPFLKKEAVPVRVPAPGATGLTVAVKVTGMPVPTGFAWLDVMPVVVLALLTVCGLVFNEPLLELNVPLHADEEPAYCAVIVWFPTESDGVVNCA